jgi:hypothetical protein
MKIKGVAESGNVYLDGIPLFAKKSQSYLNLNPDSFAWGDNSSGSAQLAFAILLEHYGAPIDAIEQYKEFQRKFITPLPKGKDFEIEIHAWPLSSFN